MPKSMTFGTGTPSCSCHEDVRRLDVAVDDPLLVRVLDQRGKPARRVASRSWVYSGCSSSQYSVIGMPADQFHHEERSAWLSVAPGIQHPRDVRVVHHRQRLPLLPRSRATTWRVSMPS